MFSRFYGRLIYNFIVMNLSLQVENNYVFKFILSFTIVKSSHCVFKGGIKMLEKQFNLCIS